METWIAFVAYVTAPFTIGYLIGSIPFGLILTKFFTKQDIRNIGSGNIGATNVLRTGNKKLAIATLLLDFGKGSLPLLLILFYTYYIKKCTYRFDMGISEECYIYAHGIFMALAGLIGFGAIIGHCFPVWLKFKGGKGVATSLGVLLVIFPYAGLTALIAWIIAAIIFRISSLSSLIAIVIIAPIVTSLLYGQMMFPVLIAVIICLRHKENIKRIISGTEPKIGGSKNVVQTK